jgi:hypothetical protein
MIRTGKVMLGDKGKTELRYKGIGLKPKPSKTDRIISRIINLRC